jgi:putative spermidine/putrescine transport system permease protein
MAVVMAALALFFGITLIWPLATVVVRSIGSPLPVHYVENLSRESVRIILWRTVRLAAVVTVVSLVLAYPAAYGLTLMRPRWRRVAIALILLPSLASFLVRTYGWMATLGSSGPVVLTLRTLGLEQQSLIGTFTGLTIAMVHMLLPLMILPIYTAMAAVDRAQLTAAKSLGARPAEAVIRIFVPQTLSGVVSGIALVFIAALGFFVTPALIGGTRETTIAQLIYLYLSQLYNWGRATSLALILLAVVLLILALAGRAARIGRAFGLATTPVDRTSERPGRGSRAWRAGGRLLYYLPGQRRHLGLSRIALLLVLIVLDLPLLFVLAVSFQPMRVLALPLDSVSLRWYEVVLADSQWLSAGWLSLRLALVAAVFGLAIGYFAAWRVRASGRAMRYALTGLCLAPLAVPHIVLAVGIYGVYLQLGLIGSFIAIAAAHALLALPYVFVNIINGMAGYDERLDLAASSLGARLARRLWRVKIPLLMPAIVAAAAFAFLVSLEELILTLFIGGIGFSTLPLRMWAGAIQNLSPELAVVGTMLIVLIGLVGGGAALLAQIRGRRLGTSALLE